MTNHARSCGRQIRSNPVRKPSPPAFSEPEVHRWPHPVEGAAGAPSSVRQPSIRSSDSALYYIHCALSYQNQLLAEIKTLLEGLAEGASGTLGEK